MLPKSTRFRIAPSLRRSARRLRQGPRLNATWRSNIRAAHRPNPTTGAPGSGTPANVGVPSPPV